MKKRFIGRAALLAALVETRRDLVRRAWLAKDPGTVAEIESASMRAAGAAARATGATESRYLKGASMLVECALMQNCDDSQAIEGLCAMPEPFRICVKAPTVRALVERELSAAELRDAETYASDLLSHLERGDTSWPALQRYLASIKN